MKRKLAPCLALAALVASATFADAPKAAQMTVETVLLDGTKTVETASFDVKDGRAVFRWPRERVPARVKSVAFWPDFAEARTGEAGCWVFPNNRIGRFTRKDGRAFESWGMCMPCFGMVTPRGAFCAIATGMPYSLSAEVVVKGGVYKMRALFDKYMDDIYEDIALEFRFLSGDDADYSGIARAYRSYQLERGACRPLADRAKERPVLGYAARHPEVRVRMAWKPVPSPVPEQVTRTEPPVKPVVTFDRMVEFAEACKAAGVDGAEFCLVGWNIGGHDGRYPEIFPVEPSLGGEEKLKECVRRVQSLGYQIAAHSSFRDCYMIANTFDAEFVVEKNPDGTLKRGKTTYGGGRLFTMCPQRAYERFCPQQCHEMAALGFKGLFYLDVITSRPLYPCNDLRHRLNNGQRAVWEANILEEVKSVFGGTASEGAHDFCIGSVDSALTIQWCKPFDPPRCKLDDGYVPFWQLVYGGIVLSTPFRTMINCTANPDRRFLLKLAEFGGRPTYYVHSVFVTGREPSMGKVDLELDTDEHLKLAVGWIKSGCEEYSRRASLQFHFMDRHETPAEGLFRVTYSDGTRLVGNYNDAPRVLDGVEIPPLDYVVIPPAAAKGR
jgi:hypothetical protein